MPDRTQDLKNHRQVAVACKNYTDSQIVASEERMKWYIGEYQTTTQDDNTTAYRKTVPSGATRVKIKRIYGNSVKYTPTTASDSTTAYQKTIPSYSPSIDRASASMNILGGMSYKINQLVQNGNFADTSNWTSGSQIASKTASNNVLTIFTNASTDSTYVGQNKNFINGHKYLTLFEVKNNDNDTSPYGFFRVGTFGSTYYANNNIETTFTKCYKLFEFVETSGTYALYVGARTSTAVALNYSIQKVMLFDLTAMGIDTSDVSVATSELLKRGIDINTYQAYDSGSIRDSVVSSVVSEGTNLCEIADKASTTTNGITYKIENGTISVSGTISDSYSPQYLFIEIPLVNTIPSGTYSINWFNDTTNANLYCYNADLNNIGDYTLARFLTTTNASASGNMANGIAQIRLRFEKTYTYNLTIKPMIVKGGTAPTTYKLYYTSSLLIDSHIQALDGYGQSNPDDATEYNYIDFNAKTFVRAGYIDNGVWVASALTTDISQYLDGNEIEIEPNGTLSFESTYSAYVPSNVSYNGVIKHALATEVKYESFNVWDEEWELGSIDNTTGQNVPASNQIRSKNYIDVLPNIAYYGKYPTQQKNIKIHYYDNNKNFISNVWLDSSTNPFTTPNNCYFIRFYASTDYGTTYNHDICINISGTLNGTYKPHKPTYTRALTNNEAKYSWGITTGVRNVRDYTTNTGSLSVNVNDLGSDNYIYDSGNQAFYTLNLNDVIKKVSNADIINVLTNNYNAGRWYDLANGRVVYYNDGTAFRLYFKNTNLDSNTTAFKSSMDGVPLFYEKNTTDTEPLTPIDNIMVVEGGDTLTFVNEEGLPVPSDITYRIEVERV